MAVVSAVIGAAGAIAGAVTTAGAAVGGVVTAGLGAVGVGGSLTVVGGSVVSTGIGGAIGAGVAAGVSGGIYGAAIGGIMAGATGGDVWKGMYSGALSGAVTMGAGSFGAAVGKGLATTYNLGTGVGTALGSIAGGVTGYGGALATGQDSDEALMTGLSAGALAGLNTYSNLSQARNFDIAKQQAISDLSADMPTDFYLAESERIMSQAAPGEISIFSTAMSPSGQLAMRLGSGVNAVLGIDAPNTREAQAAFGTPQTAGPSMPEIGGAKGSVIEPGDVTGAGWSREGGALFGGLETLSSSTPSESQGAITRKKQAGLSDETLLESGALGLAA